MTNKKGNSEYLLETFEITAYKVDNRYTEHKTREDGKDACYTCKQRNKYC
jgi:hypothetical protein